MPDKLSLSDRIRAQKQALDQASAGKQKASLETSKSVAKDKQKDAQQKAALISDRIQQKAQTLKDTAPAPTAVGTLSPEELTTVTNLITGLKARYSDLVKRVQMTDLIQETTNLGNQIETLPERIAQIRSRGYIFHAYMENKTEVLATQWDQMNDRVEAWLEQESQSLDDDLAQAAQYVIKLTSGSPTQMHRIIAEKFTAALDVLETQVKASEGRIRALYDAVDREVGQTDSQLNRIAQYLEWTESATFQLQNGESVFIVAEAEWDDNRDKPDGYLFVTNRRVLFEQNEKTGKKLGFFGGKQTQSLLWETELGTIEQITPEDKGLFGGKDLIHLKLGSGAPYAQIDLEIKGGIDSKDWAQQMNRAVRGLINQESTVEPDPDMIERLRKAPTDCPNCAGTLPQINANDNQVTCKYCGNVIRI